MKVLVDLNRCQSYGQCVFAAPGFRGEESVEYDHGWALNWAWLREPGRVTR